MVEKSPVTGSVPLNDRRHSGDGPSPAPAEGSALVGGGRDIGHEFTKCRKRAFHLPCVSHPSDRERFLKDFPLRQVFKVKYDPEPKEMKRFFWIALVLSSAAARYVFASRVCKLNKRGGTNSSSNSCKH